MQLFSNNATSTLAANLLASGDTLQVAAGHGARFSTLPLLAESAGDDFELLTLVDGDLVEIVKASKRTTDTLYLSARGLEGTTARDWPTGTKVEARITKGSLQSLVRNYAQLNRSLAYPENNTAGAKIANLAPRQPDTAYTAGQTALHSSGPYASSLLFCLRGGTTGPGSLVLSPGNAGFEIDGSVLWVAANITQQDDYSAVALGGMRTGANRAFGGGIAMGYRCLSMGGLALGVSANALFVNSVGLSGKANHEASMAVFATSTHAGGVFTGLLPSNIHIPNWMFGYESFEYCGRVGMFTSEPMDLTGGAVWAGEASAKHGYVVKPSTPNGCQYVRWDTNYDYWGTPDLAMYTPGITGASEPEAWPTTFADSVSDGDGDWVCIPHDGSYVLTLPVPMVVEEVGFIALDTSGISAQANVSIGTTGDLTRLVNNQPTVNLGVDTPYSVCKWSLSQPRVVPDITIKLDTLAAGTRCLGRFYFKGYLINHWV
jgi:hypothetical protein